MPSGENEPVKSLIYSNIWIYRTMMNVLYSGRYKRRFEEVIALVGPDDRNVLELCFGDTYIAEFCRDTARTWTGLDINQDFIEFAQRKGHDARMADISSMESLPPADVCIMMGSLYHFNQNTANLFHKMLSSSNRLIISEPVRNLSSRSGVIGKMARYSANAGKGHEHFRFSRTTLISKMDEIRQEVDFTYEIISENRDILIVIRHD